MRDIVALPDPVGELIEARTLPNGLDLRKVSVPLGVVAIIYEARPNVTVDAAALAIKSGNAVVLRGSSTAERSNAVLARIVAEAGEGGGLPEGSVQLLGGGDRDDLLELVQPGGWSTSSIPRGGEGLKDVLKQNATVPVIYAAAGNCHVYVDASADPEMAQRVAFNAKVQRPGVCNASETLLVHAEAAPAVLPGLLKQLQDAGVELRIDGGHASIAGSLGDTLGEATEEDWATEYLGMTMAVGVVDSLDEAIEHVNRYGTGHSEAIVTGDERAGERFHGGGRRGLRLRQRLDTIHRRRRVRHGRRDGQLDAEAARAWPDRPARADDVQVRRPRHRADPGIARIAFRETAPRGFAPCA